MDYRLLSAFKALFDGKRYLHRSSTQGDRVAQLLYEDLVTLGRSKSLSNGVTLQQKVLNVQNQRRGVIARRGDGAFGEIVPGVIPVSDSGFKVARGPIATIEIGVEVKILAKAMIKQIDRVINDLKSQVVHFQRRATNPICVGIVGINYAEYTVGYEGDRAYPTDGRQNRHPIQEAAEAHRRLRQDVADKFYEFVILKYRATNNSPYLFEWVSYADMFQDYGAALTRISREYDIRFP